MAMVSLKKPKTEGVMGIILAVCNRSEEVDVFLILLV